MKKYESFKSIINRVDKEELNQYYIVEMHSEKEALEKFNLTMAQFYNVLKHYNLSKKVRYNDAKNILTKEILHQKYTVELMTIKDIAKTFGVAKNTVELLLKEYLIEKPTGRSIEILTSQIPRELFKEYYINQNLSVKDMMSTLNISQSEYFRLKTYFGLSRDRKTNSINVNSSNISKEKIIDYYILQDHNRLETIEYFNLTFDSFRNLLEHYNIVKHERVKELEYYNDIKNRIPKNALKNYYITENHLIEDTLNYFNISKPILCRLMNDYNLTHKNGTSGYEADIMRYFPDIEFEIKNRAILDGKEIDLYCPKYNFGIEFNGDYWHSSLCKDKKYHLEKSLLAQEKGVRLIHIYEHEWNDERTRNIIISMVNIIIGKIPNKIYARDCEIKEISNNEAKSFNNVNHLQGHRNAQVTYGLYYNNELVQLMSFSKTRYNKNLKSQDSWEIIRGCPGSNNLVVGGVSKLFKHFIKDYKPKQIFSYCDFNKFDGKGYEAIGMKLTGYTGPDMKWLMPNHVVVNRKPSKHKEYSQMAKAQIWGSGSKKYLWEAKEEVVPCA